MSLRGQKQFLAGMTVAVALLVGATGCVGDDPPVSAPSPTTPVPSAEATTAVLSCDQLLPVDDAAEAAGVPADSLTVADYGSDGAGSIGAVRIAMTAAAHAASGQVDCVRLQPAAGDSRAAGVQLSVLPGGVDAFVTIEPDVNDGLGGFEATDVGDAAFFVCNDGESDSCRIEATSGDTWFSLRVSPRPADTAPFSALAVSVSALVHDLAQPRTAVRPVGCDTLTDADALAAVSIPDPIPEDYLVLDDRASLAVASARRGTIADCSWTGSSGGVSVHAIPTDDTSPVAQATGGARSGIPLEPLSGLGHDAVGGCTDHTCEIDVLGDEVWMSVQAFGDAKADFDALQELAARLLSRLEA